MTFETFIVCDDIRHEEGGKKSLMGIYDNEILFTVGPENKNTWPKYMKICLLVRVVFNENNLADIASCFGFGYTLNDNDYIEICQGNISKHDIKEDRMSMVFVFPHFQFDEPGDLRFFLLVYDDSVDSEPLYTICHEEYIHVAEVLRN